ncbi:hypothetical protein TrST_g5718 [Triparma strigata]|uniref:Uncharacterized protein n=1 Tax=Triparma strigata TaxID=1606541 RepID=A0A9W7ATV8_9STRA|nr:hypothetical protein TrST_g5718 [Triparma strigata]
MLKSLERCYELSSSKDIESDEEVVKPDLSALERSFAMSEDEEEDSVEPIPDSTVPNTDLSALERSFSKKSSYAASALDPNLTASPTTSLHPLTSRIVSSITLSSSPLKTVNIFTPLTSLYKSQSKLNSENDVNQIYDHNILNDIVTEVGRTLGCDLCYSSACKNTTVPVLKTINEFDTSNSGSYIPSTSSIMIVNARTLSDTIWIRDLIKKGCEVVLINPMVEVVRGEEVFVLEPFEIVSLGKFLIIGSESFVDVFWKEEEEYEYIGRKEGGWGVEDVMGIVRGYLDKRGNG